MQKSAPSLSENRGSGNARVTTPFDEPAAIIDELVRAHGPKIEGYLRLRLADADAKDACQEVWLAAQRGLAGLKDRSRPLPWLIGIAHNKSIDAWRRPKMDQLVSEVSRSIPLGSIIGIQLPATPSAELRAREQANALRAAVERIDPEDWELVYLRFVVGLMPAEIAESRGQGSSRQTCNNIAQRIVRAVRRLRKDLLQHELFASRR